MPGTLAHPASRKETERERENVCMTIVRTIVYKSACSLITYLDIA